MGLIFRKSVKVMPGVKLNFSKKGMSSISFGGKGGRVTFGNKRTTTTIGIPGTGLRYQTSKSQKTTHSTTPVYSGNTSQGGSTSQWGCGFLLIGIFLFLGFLLIGHNPGWAFGSLGFFAFLYFLSAVASNSSSPKSHVVESSTTTNANVGSYNTHVANANHLSQANDLYNRISDDTKYHYSKLDPLLIDAIVAVYTKEGALSVAGLQRRLSVGFARACKLMDLMDQIGLTAQTDGSYNRILMVSQEDLPIALDSIDLSNLIMEKEERENKEIKRMLDQTSFDFELPRRKQIYEESVKLMQTTKVFNTLVSRYQDVIDFIKWACDMQEAGCSCSINMSKEDAITQANDCYNESAYRICENTINAADTPRKKLNAIKKIQAIAQSLKDSPNKDQIRVSIDTLIEASTDATAQITQNTSSIASTSNNITYNINHGINNANTSTSTDKPINIFWTE